MALKRATARTIFAAARRAGGTFSVSRAATVVHALSVQAQVSQPGWRGPVTVLTGGTSVRLGTLHEGLRSAS